VVYRPRAIPPPPARHTPAWEPIRSNKKQLDNEARWSGA